MKKLTLALIVAVSVFHSDFIFSNSVPTNNPELNWTGFYVGGNAGHWESQKDKIVTTGSTNYINPTFASGAGNIANALAQMGNNSFSLDPNGFIGGGQVGYNYQFSKGVLLGLDINFDALTNSSNTYTLQRTVNLADFAESYAGSLEVNQKINNLGAVRARLGYLFYPTFLVFATGGFAFGNVTLDTTWTAQESLGPTVFPGVTAQNNVSKTLTGWTAGGGVEWLFKPNWSASLEYIYYDLDGLNAPVTLAQTNASTTPPALWGSAAANTNLSLSVGTIRLGINYHFS